MIVRFSKHLMLAVLAAAAGFIGGRLANLTDSGSSQRLIPSAVKARKFEVVDERGRVVAELTGRALNLMDDRGRIRASLRLRNNGNGILGFSDPKWEGRAIFGFLGKDYTSAFERDENWGLAVYDPDRRKMIASLATGNDGNRGSLVVTSSNGVRELAAP